MNQYENYKESDITWIGKIPAHWKTKRLKTLVENVSDKVSAGNSGEPYIGLENIQSWTGKYIQSNQPILLDGTANQFQETDFLFCKLRPYLAKAFFPESSGKCSTELLVLRALRAERKFLFYFSLSDRFIQIVNSSTYGAKMPRASWDFIGNLHACLPNAEQQRLIARYLDKETTRIDKLITNKRQQIKKLNELRQITVLHTVTRGLDPAVSMKDSGIAWLGKIPANWRVKKIRHLAKVGNGSTPNRSDNRYWSGGSIPWLNSSSVNKGFIAESDQFVTETAATECHLPLVKPGSVLVAITGQGKTRGTAALLEFESTINQHMAYISPQSSNLDSMYLYQLLVGLYAVLRMISEGTGSTKGALTCDDVKNFKIPVPHIDEQRSIAKHVENEMLLLDRLTKNIELQIENLEDLRKITINDAVTGKAKVTD